MPQVKFLYGENFNDYIPIYCELTYPYSDFAESVDEVTELKLNIVWDEVSDDQKESYFDILVNFSFQVWAVFISCIIM